MLVTSDMAGHYNAAVTLESRGRKLATLRSRVRVGCSNQQRKADRRNCVGWPHSDVGGRSTVQCLQVFHKIFSQPRLTGSTDHSQIPPVRKSTAARWHSESQSLSDAAQGHFFMRFWTFPGRE